MARITAWAVVTTTDKVIRICDGNDVATYRKACDAAAAWNHKNLTTDGSRLVVKRVKYDLEVVGPAFTKGNRKISNVTIMG